MGRTVFEITMHFLINKVRKVRRKHIIHIDYKIFYDSLEFPAYTECPAKIIAPKKAKD